MLVSLTASIIIWLLIRLCLSMCGLTIQMNNVVLAHTSFWEELNCWKSGVMDYAGFWNRYCASFSRGPGEINYHPNWVPNREVLHYLTGQWPRPWQEWSNHLSSVFRLVQAWSMVAKDGGQIYTLFSFSLMLLMQGSICNAVLQTLLSPDSSILNKRLEENSNHMMPITNWSHANS